MAASLNDITCLLFDCDGTLIDTYDIIVRSMRHAINDLLCQDLADDELMAGVGTPLEDQIRGFLGEDSSRVEEIVAAYREHNDAFHDDAVRAFSGVRDGLSRLEDAGFAMGVVTSKRHFLADRGLALCGIRDFFDVLIAPDDFPAHKPDPGPVLEACWILEADPCHTAYVGDSPFDIEAGNAAGCVSIAALWGMFSADALRAERPDFMASSFEELVELLTSRDRAIRV